MEAQEKDEVQLLLIHDLGTRWGEWSASRPGRPLPPGKGPPVPIGQESVLHYECRWNDESVLRLISSVCTDDSVSSDGSKV
jgi:hypothetical protein